MPTYRCRSVGIPGYEYHLLHSTKKGLSTLKTPRNDHFLFVPTNLHNNSNTTKSHSQHSSQPAVSRPVFSDIYSSMLTEQQWRHAVDLSGTGTDY